MANLISNFGTVVKRFKAVDDILKRMKECFDSTMSRELLDDFEPPDCIAQIRDYLRQKRHVIVTGTVGRSYLQVALTAIKDVNTHGPNVSAEISFPSDWRHIDPSEIKFILCTNPFGDHDFDAQKAPAMLDVLCQIMNSAYAGELTLAIVTKKDVLVQAQEVFGKDHDVLQNIVEPYAETTEENPEIILSRSTISCCTPFQRTTQSALQDFHPSFDVTETSYLPTQNMLNELCFAFGRKSSVVSSTCKNICKQLKGEIKSALPKENCVVDIYPAYCIDSDREIVFVVTLKEEVDTSLLKRNVKYRIEIRILGKPCSELTYCRKKLQEIVSIDDQTKVQRCLSAISHILLTRHKYLSVITASSVKSHHFVKKEKKSDITQQLCIVLCVHAKGFIPIDEDQFPDNYNGIPTDVMEGSFTSFCKTANEKHANLRMGCEIQRKVTEVTGTLGGFIEHPEYGTCGIISAHVALHSDELFECKYRGGHLKLHHWPERYVNDRAIYQPAAYDESQPIGQLMEAIYIEGDYSTSGVDIAIFQITDRFPADGKFPAQSRNGIKEPTTLEYKSGKTIGSVITSNQTLWKYGKTSGQTRGQMVFRIPFVSVKEINFNDKINDFQVIQMKLYEVTSNDERPFACPGDSGALVFLEKDDLDCVGVIEGGFKGGGPVFVSPINSILKHCNVTQLKSFYPSQGEMAASISELQTQVTNIEQTMATNFSEILRKLEEIQQGKTTNNNANPDQ